MLDVEDAFYKVAIAWMERNQDLAKEYISENLYDKHKSQTDWMKIRKEKNILENMKLIKATPIGLKDSEGIKNDFLWIHIEAQAIDYIINPENNELLRGYKNKTIYYEEYWKFIKNNHRWILDEIRQIDDIDDVDFFHVDIS